MNVFDYFRASQPQKTAMVAKERLQIIVAHERRQRDASGIDYFLPLLERELIEVVRKYIMVGDDDIKVHLEKQGNYEILELNITLPEQNT